MLYPDGNNFYPLVHRCFMAATRRTTSSMTSEQFLDALIDAKILDAEQVGLVLNEFHQTDSGSEADDLAKFLVRAGLVTLYQVSRVLSGDAKALVLGPYTLQQPIGTGSLGTVYSAIRRSDQARFALKVLPLRNMWNVLQAKKQLKEFDSLSDVHAIVPFVDIGTAAGSHYLVWPFVEGESFDHLLLRTGALSSPQTARILYEIAEGMSRCHEQGIVHGMLKPSNIMLGPDRSAHILDLGIGGILMSNIAEDDSMLDTISTANTALNMIDFTAPESFADPNVRTVSTDMYSLGCTAYFFLTNSVPYPEGNTVHKIIAHQTSPPPELNTDQVEPKLAELVQQMMAKSPTERPQTMREVLDCLIEAFPTTQNTMIDMPISEAERLAQKGRAAAYLPRKWVPDNTSANVSHDLSGAEGLIDFNSASVSDTMSRPSAQYDYNPDLDTIDRETDPSTEDQPLTPSEIELAVAKAPSLKVSTTEPRPASQTVVQKARRWLQSFFVKNDVVQFSLFGPSTVVPGRTSRLQVYIHPPAAFVSVKKLSRAFQPTTELIASVTSTNHPLRGKRMNIQLIIDNMGLSRSKVPFVWTGQTRPLIFDVYVPWESVAGVANGHLTIHQDAHLLGSSELALKIASRTN